MWDLKDGLLYSVAFRVAWEGPVIRADVKPYDAEHWDKLKESDMSAGKTWMSGIYAVNSWALAIDTLSAYRAHVVGEVELWGRVVVFDLGYRAEYCMIRKLWLAKQATKEEIDQLERLYQCDVGFLPYVSDTTTWKVKGFNIP